MSKTKRYSNSDLFKQQHRERLKAQGNVHLPANKIETPKTAYKRVKVRKYDINLD